MMKASLIACLAAMLCLAAPVLGGDEEGEPPAQFDSYWMVFLERGDSPPELSDEERSKLQRLHLGHLGKVWREGYSLVAGPFDAGEHGKLRGIVLYRGDLEEARVLELAGADPMVQAGWLQVRALKWFTGARMLTFQPPPAEE